MTGDAPDRLSVLGNALALVWGQRSTLKKPFDNPARLHGIEGSRENTGHAGILQAMC